jgi:hypothetical protein
MKTIKKVGAFHLVRIMAGNFIIRVHNNNNLNPVSVVIYFVSGINAERSARRIFQEVTRAWNTAITTDSEGSIP